MATVALASLFAFVHIIYFVTVDAPGDFFIFRAGFVFVKIVFVALVAGYFFVFAM